MTTETEDITDAAVTCLNPGGSSSVLLVCEHASRRIPDHLGDLGLSPEARRSHVAWDPGALAVARDLSDRLDAALVAGTISRLVYDCNRPPEAPDAIPTRSEATDIPGNRALSAAARAGRIRDIYAPFHAALAHHLARRPRPVLVTIHSYTPVFHGHPRPTELGILHDRDARLADAMLARAGDHLPLVTRRNDPYGPADGVTHTLRRHALGPGHPNVMLEIRNDLIATDAQQRRIAGGLASLLADAFAATGLPGDVACRA
jgi:predicted N-formylglutamate amidohydrolase